MINPAVLYLSSQGDSFKRIREIHPTLGIEIVGPNKEDGIHRLHPYLKKAKDCKTHLSVLKFLKEMPSPRDMNLELYHSHNPEYPSHSINIGFGKVIGAAHKCPKEKMIDFVKIKIREQAYNSDDLDKFVNSIPLVELKEFIDVLREGLKKAEIKVTFLGSRKVKLPNEHEVHLDKIARLVNSLYHKCNDGDLRYKEGGPFYAPHFLIENYAMDISKTIGSFYLMTDMKIANSNLFTRVLVWFREFFERILPYSPRWHIEFNND